MELLDEATWRARERAHALRIDALVSDAVERRKHGKKHPVEDFLFEYYSHRPGKLRQWHPGFGVGLEGCTAEWRTRRGYVVVAPSEPGRRTEPGQDAGSVVTVGTEEIARLSATLDFVIALFTGMSRRPAQFGCFGLHEWAMVYMLSPQEVRHTSVPLRRSPEAIAAVVEENGLRCTHYDAFRFYTEPARPLNIHQPTADTRLDLEQGGCLHANMDLYKWAYKLSPIIPGEVVADCFELARDIRTLDMRAAPYDLTDWGYLPVPVETSEGRADYVRQQRGFAQRAAVLRAALLETCREARAALTTAASEV